ncbi:MAG: hypothetical protein AAGB51_04345 [Planctomycetota bacterium]
MTDPGATGVWVVAAGRFFGSGAATGDPFDLLGLENRRANDAAVVASLRQRLEAVNRHPDAATTAAEEVRIALHAAAAKLMDPRVRARLRAATPAQPTRRPPDDTPESPDDLLAHDCLLVLARAGGWNRGALRELLRLAAARGVDPARVPTIVDMLLTHGSAAVTRTPAGPLDSDPAIDARPARHIASADGPTKPETRRRSRFGPIVTVLAVPVLIAWSGFYFLGQRQASVVAPIDTPTRAEESRLTPVLPPTSEQVLTGPTTVAELLRSLEDTTTLTSESGGTKLRLLLTYAAESWTNWDTPTRRAIEGRTTEVAGVLGGQSGVVNGLSDPLVEWMRRDLDTEHAVERRVFAVGLASRLLASGVLPARDFARLATALDEAVPGGYSTGGDPFLSAARAAIENLVPELAMADDAATDAWFAATDRLAQSDPVWREGVLFRLAETQILTAGQSAPPPQVAALLARAVRALDWQADGATREWLLDLIRGDAGGPALSLLLTELNQTPATGLGRLGTLSSRASGADRANYAARLAASWGIEPLPTAVPPPVGWRDAIARVARRRVGESHAEVVAALVESAELNAAAALAWRGRAVDADAWVAGLEQRMRDIVAPTGMSDSESLAEWPAGSDWLVRYQNSERSAAERVRLLDSLRSGTQLATGDADVLVREAFIGRPASVREAAASAVTRLSGDPAVIKGALEFAPAIPRTLQAGRLWATLTGFDVPAPADPDWTATIRRGLVARLVGSLSATSETFRLDALSDQLGAAYALASEMPMASEGAPGAEVLRPAADQLLGLLLADLAPGAVGNATGLSSSSIEQGLVRRDAIAGGPVHTFVARQAACAEALALLAEGEGRPLEAAEVLSRLRQEVSRSGTVFEQALAYERAMSRLWELRFTREAGMDVGSPP